MNLIHVVKAPVFNHQEIHVVSEHNPVLKQVQAKPPKLFVGISLTPPSVKNFDPSFWIFPAVLDTGLNKAFEIDRNHLEAWTNTRVDRFTFIKKRTNNNRHYDIRAANIWLHRYPYKGPKFSGPDAPLRLRKSDEIRVISTLLSADRDPRFPLLGLEALIENQLLMTLDNLLSQSLPEFCISHA